MWCKAFAHHILPWLRPSFSSYTIASVGVDLFQHFVDVNAVGFLPPPLLFLITGAYGFSLAGFLGSFAWNFGWHVVGIQSIMRGPGFCTTYMIAVVTIADAHIHFLTRAALIGQRDWLARRRPPISGAAAQNWMWASPIVTTAFV